MRITVVLVLVALSSPAAMEPRQPAGAALTLRGLVVTDNDVPLARVRVAVAESTEPPIYTDARGQFALRVPDTQSVRLMLTKARYVALTTDVRRGDLRDSTGLRVRLSLGAVISGHVRDRSGEPVLNAQVTARRLDAAVASGPPVLVTTTDDLGEFRFGGLDAGAYAVAVRRVQAGAERNIPETFEEQTITVSRGGEVGVDVRIDMPSELARYPQGYRVQPGPDATASVRGRVVTAQGVPIPGVLVQVRGPGGLTQVESDDRGRYELARLAPGEYRIEAIKRGFMPVVRGQGQNVIELLLRNAPVPDRTILLRAGETTSPVDLTLGRGASVVGTIVDEFGEPMQGVSVDALEMRVIGGRTRALHVSTVAGGRAQTDDRGRYRLFGLQPGTYVIRAVANALVSPATGYVPMFYPGTPSIDAATPAKLEADASASGIDFTLLPSRAGRVHGTVIDPAGKPVRVDVTLTMRGDSGAIHAEPVRTISNADGTFAFNNVPPGEYVVQVMAAGRSDPDSSAAGSRQYVAAVVTVTGDDAPPLSLRLSAGATLIGRVVYEGIATPPPLYTGVSLMTVSVDSERDRLLDAYSAGFVLLSDNRFEYRGVFGRNYLAARPANADWYVRSITYRGQDLADSAFDFGSTETFRDIEVVVSGAGAAVSGRVSDERAAPVRDYTVAVFPTDRSKWTLLSRWLKAGRSSPDGTFRLTGLVPGDYWVVAVDRLEGSTVAGDLQSPEILEALSSRAVRITAGEGQSLDIALRLIRR